MAKIRVKAPQSLKRDANINLVGAIFAGPGSILMFATGVVWYIPGLDYLMVGIGALFCAYAFAKQPKLGYVLPFRVYRLIAIDTRSGIPLFTHDWGEKDLVEASLFAGAIQGVSGILNESLHQGTMQEIKLERGFLILYHVQDVPVAFILITTKSSRILKIGLQLFAEKFASSFGPILQGDIIADLTLFTSAEQLLQDSFPFLVPYC